MTRSIVVDLGRVEGTNWPDGDTYATTTLIGAAGTMTAHLVKVVKVCETLCGNESEECHHEGRYAPARALAIGTPVAALPGEHSISAFTSMSERTPLPDFDVDELSEEFSEPIWPVEDQGGTRYRLRRSGDSFTLEYAWGLTDAYSMPLGACSFYDRGPAVRMSCSGFESLLVERTPILVSVPDYNAPGADLIASFAQQGLTYYVVRLALKVQTVYGLLFREQDGWSARFHPRDYDLLC